MSRRIKPTILIAAALILFAAVYALPDSVSAVELLVITNTPTPTFEITISPTPTFTPTLTATSTPTLETTIDTPTPTATDPAPPPPPPEPKETEVVLLPATGEFPIDPQLGIQLFLAFALLVIIGIVLFRAVKGSKAQE
jgi:outer membrane biosynthesis protein TonB